MSKKNFELPSVLWHCWLGGRKGIRPVKKLSGGMLAWLCIWVKVQICMWSSWCHWHPLSLAPVNPDWGFTFLVLPLWCWLIQVVPDRIQEGHKMVVCVCVCVRACMHACVCACLNYHMNLVLISNERCHLCIELLLVVIEQDAQKGWNKTVTRGCLFDITL